MVQSNEITAIIKAKNRDYLIGFIDGLIHMKNQTGHKSIEIVKGDFLLSSESNEILGPVYLALSCPCGNYIAFKNSSEIPDKSFKCSLCDENYIIYYTEEQL
ncbi:MAG: hypothetical protein PHF86_06410 [Candidatus Nanoarchaeia archaeon]|jgi:hypothetical protein|nr:hypothetical protein [Candidatus Nanoarchaeia archaeon]